MSAVMEEEIKRWTARRKSALVLEIIQGKTTVAEASRAFDITPSEIETWIEEGKRGLENALRAKPEDVREQYERQLKDLQEAYGEAMLELRARKKLVLRQSAGTTSGLTADAARLLLSRQQVAGGRPWPCASLFPIWTAGIVIGVRRASRWSVRGWAGGCCA